MGPKLAEYHILCNETGGCTSIRDSCFYDFNDYLSIIHYFRYSNYYSKSSHASSCFIVAVWFPAFWIPFSATSVNSPMPAGGDRSRPCRAPIAIQTKPKVRCIGVQVGPRLAIQKNCIPASVAPASSPSLTRLICGPGLRLGGHRAQKARAILGVKSPVEISNVFFV